MCGILGWLNPAIDESESARRLAVPALKAMHGRGPDGSDVKSEKGWLLGHTRLAIIDLTEHASQPMTDGQGGWLVYNGEIYNFRELRAELIAKGFVFRSTGDGEVLLHALRCWGTDCLGRLRGMFAFGWLDAKKRELILARDRYGVKPLAYQHGVDEFKFASDLFALQALPGAADEIDSEAAYLYLGLGYVPAPHSIFKSIRKVQPGHYLRVSWSATGEISVSDRQYWSIAQVPPAAVELNGTRALDEYERQISKAIQYRLISDVPVGSLLSGGIDSSLVTAVCREQPEADIPSFTMGFDDPAVDEAPFARAIANELGGKHHEFLVSESDVLGIWDQLWTVYDEPFADSSALPMVALCREVSKSVTVALSGDGGDETLCGYPWHRALDRLAGPLRMAGFLRRPMSATASRLSPELRYKATVFSQSDRVAQWSALRTGFGDDSGRSLPVESAGTRPSFREYFAEWSRDLNDVRDPLDWACRLDLLTYLPDDLMVKSDRASMRFGLEMREPLLDHELTSWCLQLPVAERFDRATRTGKLLSRAALGRRFRRELYERPKRGFTPPLHRWLDGPLRPAVHDALERLKQGAIAPLQLPEQFKDWQQCAAQLNDLHQQFLWRVVCFSEWMKQRSGRDNFAFETPLWTTAGDNLSQGAFNG